MKTLIAALLSVVFVLPASVSAATRLEVCEQKLSIAQQNGIIHRMSVEKDGVHVVVDSGVWEQSPYTTKLGIAAVVECAIAGPENRLVGVIFRDSRTNKVVGRYRYPELKVE